MNPEPQRNTLDQFLTKDERLDVADRYAELVDRIMYIGDPDYRARTRQDIDRINHYYEQASRNSIWDTQALEAFDYYKGIIGASDHTTLAKVYAAIALVDVVYPRGDVDLTVFFQEVDRTEPQDEVNTILLGAFYGRYMDWIMRNEDQGVIEEFDRAVIGHVTNKERALRKVRIHAVARKIADDIRVGAFGMQLPIALINSDLIESESPDYQNKGLGIPQSIMFLQEGYLPSWPKLVEAVVAGIPNDVGPGIHGQRIMRLLAGVQVAVPGKTRESDRRQLIKKLYHISLRALRRSDKHINWETALMGRDTQSFTSEKLLDACSFDSLSFILAIRLIRRLKNTQGLAISNVISVVDNYMDFLKEPYDTWFGDTRSILAVAHTESQRIDEGKDWTLKQAEIHLRSQIIGLVVFHVYGNGEVTLRQQEDLWDVFKMHILKKDLSEEDKLEMMAVLMQDRSNRLWRGITKYGTIFDVDRWVRGEGYLPTPVARYLLEHIEENIVLRAETIRDMHPQYLEGQVLRPNDEPESNSH